MKILDNDAMQRATGELPLDHIINVLSRDDFRRQHIPGSINIPVDDERFIERVELSVGGRTEPVVVYCASEQCDASSTAAQKLEEAGFTDVAEYSAGMQGWQQAGLPVEGDESQAA
jgi:rhodanese-related sulfurtransferase